jgi:hypothetical protein
MKKSFSDVSEIWRCEGYKHHVFKKKGNVVMMECKNRGNGSGQWQGQCGNRQLHVGPKKLVMWVCQIQTLWCQEVQEAS